MDPSKFKVTTVSRGFKYYYYTSPAKELSKPTLLFCHGFPSSSRDWRFIVGYFEPRGYGVIVPDMLGYGETDKPTDPEAYVGSAITRDLVDILDAENVGRAIAIGHDWGTRPVCRLASWFPERFLGYATLAVAFDPPKPNFNFKKSLETTKRLFGYEVIGYWRFFCEDDSEKLLMDNWDSFFAIVFPSDPDSWRTKLAPLGAARSTILSGYTSPLPHYITPEDKAIITETFKQNGLAGPTCWYKAQINGFAAEDDKKVPPSRYLPPPSSPIFFGAAIHDAACLPALGEALKGPAFKNHNVTIKEYDADHWLILSKHDEISRDLEVWIEVVLSSNAPPVKANL